MSTGQFSPAAPPRAGTVIGLLLAAAVVGFLGGGLVGALQQSSLLNPPTAAPSPTTQSPTPEPAASITVTADRSQASTSDLIRLEGDTQPPAPGVVLQVEQSVDGGPFAAFPVSIQTRADGTYGVSVRTGRTGVNRFRMVGTVGGEQVASDPVTVRVG